MISEEKVRLMTRLARYEQKEGREELQINRYFRRDYIGMALLKNFLWTTLGYFLVLLLYFGYHMEFYLDNATKMSWTPVIVGIIAGYVVMLTVYSIITYIICSLRYIRAKQGIKRYTETLNRLMGIYRREEKKYTASETRRKSK